MKFTSRKVKKDCSLYVLSLAAATVMAGGVKQDLYLLLPPATFCSG